MGELRLKKTKDWKSGFVRYSYRALFEEAVERTAELGLPKPEIVYTDNTYWTPVAVGGFDAFIREERKELLADGLDGLSERRVQIHVGLLEPLQEFLSCKAYLTVGSVTRSKNEWYALSEKDVRRWLKEGPYGDDLNLHVWLTLDSLEILDMTFLPAIVGVGERSEFSRRTVATNPDTLPRAQPQLPIYPSHGLNCRQGGVSKKGKNSGELLLGGLTRCHTESRTPMTLRDHAKTLGIIYLIVGGFLSRRILL
jgi:hypothetical protein